VHRWKILAATVLAAALSASTPALPLPATATSAGPAQEATGEPRVLGIDDYGRWRSVEAAAISDDGTWVSFAYTRREEDDELHLRSVTDGSEHVVQRANGAVFSDDSRFVAYELSPPFEEVEKLEEEGEPVPIRVQLMELDSGTTWTWDDVEGFEFADGSRALAVQRGRPEDDESADEEGGDGSPRGSDLIVRFLERGYEELLGSVDEFAFNDPGTHLAYTVDAESDNGNGVYLMDLESGARRALDNAAAQYARLTWDEDGTSLAVLRGTVPEEQEERANVLLAFPGIAARTGADLGSAAAIEEKRAGNPASDGSFPDDFVLSQRGEIAWNADATMVFVGIKEQRPEPEKTDEPIADVDIFHWRDERIQTVQKARVERDRNFTYRSVLHLEGPDGEPRFVRLADERMRRVRATRDGRWAVGEDAEDYISDWKPRRADYYRIDTATGERTPMLEGFESDHVLGLSPDGTHFLVWKEGHVQDWRMEDAELVNLTVAAASGPEPVDFTDTEWDYHGTPPPWGLEAWTEDGQSVILEHQYDPYLQPLDGGRATNLTADLGTDEEIRLRLRIFDEEEARVRFPDGSAATVVDLDEPQLLSAFGRWTKNAGLFELPPGGGEPAPVVWADKRFDRVEKAADAGRWYYTVEDFRQFPDWWVADYELGAGGTVDREPAGPGVMPGARRITEANPWQDEYRWGRRILFDYTNDDGVRLQGILAVPDGHEPGQRRPMIVRFYEKMSDRLHSYPMPRYRHSPNFAGYVSAGYLVMQPDVHFRVGSSHSDMLECVEAATRKVIEMGYADPEAIGLSGHSYSGGGSSYIAGRSDMFAAVASGAAPINLTSEFNQIFPGSGQVNHGYDIYGQGRYATDPYTDPELYRRESPITYAPEMDTPLLYLHGAADQVVGYVQGVEWYHALRFNRKPIIFLSYPGEGHGLRKYENRLDFQRRLRQFFDHHLRGEPAPAWMTEGVTYLEKLRRRERRKR